MEARCDKYRDTLNNIIDDHRISENNVNSFLDLNMKYGDEVKRYITNVTADYDIGTKLVFFFRTESCMECISNILLEIDTLVLSGMDREDIVLIGQAPNINPFSLEELRKYGQEYNTLWVKSKDYLKPLPHRPFFFITDKREPAKYLYVPAFVPSYKDEYFNEIVPRVINSSS